MSLVENNPPLVFYPSFGHLVDGGRAWRVTVTGSVSHPRPLKLSDRMLLRMLQKVMKVDSEALDSDIFRQRTTAFLARAPRGEQVAVRVGSQIHVLKKKTRRHGHFRGVFYIDAKEVNQLERDGQVKNGWLNFDAVALNDSGHEATGRVQLIEDNGLSVISDIDDTIKHTDVTSRQAMLHNTFLHEFQPVDGMADLFRQWSKQGATFHFVSSSPCQLYHPLAELCQREGFPEASFHLRPFRLRDQMLRKILLRRRGKIKSIKNIVKSFSQRRFVLLGDSGELDPELYGAVARRYPDRVASILIRELPDRPLDPERMQRAFRELPTELCSIFRCSSELSQSLADNLPSLQPV